MNSILEAHKTYVFSEYVRYGIQMKVQLDFNIIVKRISEKQI